MLRTVDGHPVTVAAARLFVNVPIVRGEVLLVVEALADVVICVAPLTVIATAGRTLVCPLDKPAALVTPSHRSNSLGRYPVESINAVIGTTRGNGIKMTSSSVQRRNDTIRGVPYVTIDP